jgi:uncharacterized protein YodC (DUF2158 family)
LSDKEIKFNKGDAVALKSGGATMIIHSTAPEIIGREHVRAICVWHDKNHYPQTEQYDFELLKHIELNLHYDPAEYSDVDTAR